MRIRTQIILAAFVLAVIPLTAIVTYSYRSSKRALEDAYRQEAHRSTRQMDGRLAAIRAELDQRMTFVSALPIEDESTPADVGSIVTVMGEAASLVDALEFHPVARNTSPTAVAQTRELPEDPPKAPEAIEESTVNVEVATGQIHQAISAAVRAGLEPIVIDLPQTTAIVRHTISEEQMELATKVAVLGAQMANPSLPREARDEMRRELQAAQRELQASVQQEVAEEEKKRQAARAALQAEITRRVRAPRRPTAQTPPEPGSAQAVAEVPIVARGSRESANASADPSAATATTGRPRQLERTPAAKPADVLTNAAGTPRVRVSTPAEVEQAVETARRTSLLLGRQFAAPVRKEGEVVGNLTARVSPDEVIRRVLGSADTERGEIPFALDREGTLYTRTSEERRQLDALGVPDRLRRGQPLKAINGWIIASSTDPQSGLRIGAARRVGENLDQLRRAAAKNLGLGLGLIAFALIGIVPLSNHLTRDVKLVTTGAERIAHGDLLTRLPVKTDNELGQLARAFNRMAEDLSVNQQKLVAQERARQEQEIQQRLLEVEYERKSVELEDARRFQLSMLPKVVPQHEAFDVAVFTRTATEVGGDYYDFHLAHNALSITIGDATGHGAKAGTMVTVVKTLFAGYNGEVAPAEFLRDAAARIRRMDLGRMAMALSLARFDGRTLILASAGMPPLFIHRAAENRVQEAGVGATPLGTMETEYPETAVELEPGDTVLLLTDGFPELMNESGQQLGYGAAAEIFASAAAAPEAAGVIASLAEAAQKWHGETPPNDDVTFVVVRVT